MPFPFVVLRVRLLRLRLRRELLICLVLGFFRKRGGVSYGGFLKEELKDGKEEGIELQGGEG